MDFVDFSVCSIAFWWRSFYRMSLLTGVSFGLPFAVAFEQCLSVSPVVRLSLFVCFCLFVFLFFCVCRGGVRSPGEVDVLVAPPYLGDPVCVSD